MTGGAWYPVAPVSVHGSYSRCQSAHSRQGGNMTAGQGYSGDEDKRIDRTQWRVENRDYAGVIYKC